MTDNPEPLTDFIQSTAASMVTLEYPPDQAHLHSSPLQAVHQHAKIAVEKALRERVRHVAADNMSDFETMLACQAQLLHSMFMNSTRNYAGNAMSPHIGMHGAIALKSQQYCRKTIGTLNALKSKAAADSDAKKSRNELFVEDNPYAQKMLDAGTKATSTGADQWLAAMEKMLWEQNL